MAFPFSHRGQIEFLESENSLVVAEEFLKRIERHLEQRKMTRLSRTRNRLFFSCGVFRRASGWDLFAFIRSGEVELQTTTNRISVLYQLRFSPVLLIGLGLFMLLLIPAIAGASDLTNIEKIGVLGAVFLVLVGTNFALPILRFTSLLRNIRNEQ